MTTLTESPVGESICLHLPLPVTDEELIRLNDCNPGWKVERGMNGELEARMIAGGASSRIAAELVRQLGNRCVGGGGGIFQDSDGTFNLSAAGIERTWAPDVSWISPERTAAMPRAQRPKTGFWNLCPDFMVEVRSPSDDLAQQQARMERWLIFGAQLGWLVDPLAQAVWIYRPNQEPEQLERPAALSGESVLEGLEVGMSEVWAFVDEEQVDAG